MAKQLTIKFDRIYRNSFGYHLLKKYINLTHNIIHYRKIYLVEKENLPKNEPVILASNHQNALMDALAVNHPIKGFNVFLARSDIFGKTFIAIILRFIKIMPIYRIRDGASNLQKNSEIFENAVKVLKYNRRLAMFPEGNHSGIRRMRPLKKGISRIAFQAAGHMDFSRNIKIVPVGLDYTDFEKFRQKLVVHFGQPLNLADYYQFYRENEQKAMTQLVRDLRNRIRPLMLNIPSKDFYYTSEQLRRLFNNDVLAHRGNRNFSRPAQLEAEQEIVDAIHRREQADPETVSDMDKRLREYLKMLKTLKIRDWVVQKAGGSFAGAVLKALLLLFLSPVFLYGYLNNLISYHLTTAIGRRIKDPQFKNSVKFVFYSFLAPLVYLLQLGIVSFFVADFWWRLAYFVSIPVTGYWAFSIFIHFKKVLGRIRYLTASKDRKKRLQELRQGLRQDILQLIAE